MEDLFHMIEHWNENRVPILRISEPDAELKFRGAMRFYFQDSGQKVATKCVNVNSDDTTADVINILIEKFRPDMRMLSAPEYGLYEIHENGEERKLAPDEKPLFVQLDWNKDDREGRFLLRRMDEKTLELGVSNEEPSLKRQLSKKEMKKKQKQLKQQIKDQAAAQKQAAKSNGIAERLYNELPETSFTRSISNPEAVMKRRRAQKLERRLQQFSAEGGCGNGGTLRIFGEAINKEVSYKTLLLSRRDTASHVVKQTLEKYGKENEDPSNYCLVQLIVPTSATDGDFQSQDPNSISALREYILDDDDCPLQINTNHNTSRGILTFHIRRKPADYQPRKRKKKTKTPQPQTMHPPLQQHQQMDPVNPNGNVDPILNPMLPMTNNRNNLSSATINGANNNNNTINRMNTMSSIHSMSSMNSINSLTNSINPLNHMGHASTPPSMDTPPLNSHNMSNGSNVWIKTIQLKKIDNSIGLSIIAASLQGQADTWGIYIKKVLQGKAAEVDGRLQSGDQLLEVDGQSLVLTNISHERAAAIKASEIIVQTGHIVTLKIAKFAAFYHGVAEIICDRQDNNIPMAPPIAPTIQVPNPPLAYAHMPYSDSQLPDLQAAQTAISAMHPPVVTRRVVVHPPAPVPPTMQTQTAVKHHHQPVIEPNVHHYQHQHQNNHHHHNHLQAQQQQKQQAQVPAQPQYMNSPPAPAIRYDNTIDVINARLVEQENRLRNLRLSSELEKELESERLRNERKEERLRQLLIEQQRAQREFDGTNQAEINLLAVAQKRMQNGHPSLVIGGTLKSPKKVSWVDNKPSESESLHTFIPSSPADTSDQSDDTVIMVTGGPVNNGQSMMEGNGDIIANGTDMMTTDVNHNAQEEADFTLQDIDAVLSSNTCSDAPGVIGTQEVYNDPRHRIERERQKAYERDEPEKFSFREKLEMFRQVPPDT